MKKSVNDLDPRHYEPVDPTTLTPEQRARLSEILREGAPAPGANARALAVRERFATREEADTWEREHAATFRQTYERELERRERERREQRKDSYDVARHRRSLCVDFFDQCLLFEPGHTELVTRIYTALRTWWETWGEGLDAPDWRWTSTYLREWNSAIVKVAENRGSATEYVNVRLRG